MSFDNIPLEMRELRQWIVWRLEINSDSTKKPVKVPYNARTGHKADITNPNDYSDFHTCIRSGFKCIVPVDRSTKPEISGYSGPGFCFTSNDPYAGLDFDNCTGEDLERQKAIYRDMDSYSELSQSGTGLHIIVKGSVPRGRRRNNIEVYSDNRYFAMTGNVFEGKNVINERQEYLNELFEQLGGDAEIYTYGEDQEQKENDDVILARAINALNGEKFKALYDGEWQSLYPSQSEADFAYIDILAFYTQNKAQIRRLFAQSLLGRQPKDGWTHRSDRTDYVKRMVERAFDRQLPSIDIEGLKIQFEKQQVPIYEIKDNYEITDCIFPPGLVGDVAQYIFDNSPTPVREIALAAAIGYISGIVGRSYNVSGTGLNQFILVIAQTGAGKEAMANGISKIQQSIRLIAPTSVGYRGPGEIVSSAGLLRALEENPCFLSIIGEFGLELKKLSAPNNPQGTSIKKLLMALYNKSGHTDILDSTSYSDRSKNIQDIIAPALTLLGETAPVRFYEALDETMIMDGLLPRFLIFEYEGRTPYYQEKVKQPVPLYIVDRVANLVGICSGKQALNQVHDVPFDAEAKRVLDKFSILQTDMTNDAPNEVTRYLWSRAHVKAMKLAALFSVGINPVFPQISVEAANMSIDMITKQINKIIKKFEKEEVGAQVASESKQTLKVVKFIKDYMSTPFDKFKVYGALEKQHYEKVIQKSVIQRRFVADATFRSDKIGATNAIEKQLKLLLDADDIGEIPKMQLQEKYGNKGKAFVVINSARFA